MKIIVKAILGALILLMSGQVGAALMTSIDPGEIGDSFTGLTVDLPGPNAESVIVTFLGSDFITLAPVRQEFSLKSFGGPFGGGNYRSDIEFGFLDEFGDTLTSKALSNVAIAAFSYGNSIDLVNPIDAYGFFFNMEDFGPINANARVQFDFNSVVGGVPPIPVPAAVWLFGTALIGLVGFGKRRKAA